MITKPSKDISNCRVAFVTEKKVQFQNPHDKLILKLSLIFIFVRKSTDMFKAKDKDQNPKFPIFNVEKILSHNFYTNQSAPFRILTNQILWLNIFSASTPGSDLTKGRVKLQTRVTFPIYTIRSGHLWPKSCNVILNSFVIQQHGGKIYHSKWWKIICCSRQNCWKRI